LVEVKIVPGEILRLQELLRHVITQSTGWLVEVKIVPGEILRLQEVLRHVITQSTGWLWEGRSGHTLDLSHVVLLARRSARKSGPCFITTTFMIEIHIRVMNT
jgi:hypothetical protein